MVSLSEDIKNLCAKEEQSCASGRVHQWWTLEKRMSTDSLEHQEPSLPLILVIYLHRCFILPELVFSSWDSCLASLAIGDHEQSSCVIKHHHGTPNHKFFTTEIAGVSLLSPRSLLVYPYHCWHLTIINDRSILMDKSDDQSLMI